MRQKVLRFHEYPVKGGNYGVFFRRMKVQVTWNLRNAPSASLGFPLNPTPKRETLKKGRLKMAPSLKPTGPPQSCPFQSYREGQGLKPQCDGRLSRPLRKPPPPCWKAPSHQTWHLIGRKPPKREKHVPHVPSKQRPLRTLGLDGSPQLGSGAGLSPCGGCPIAK